MPPAPFDGYRAVVRPEWIDANDHMNMGYFVVAFDGATDAWLDHVGLTAHFKRAHGVATFTLESHVLYLRELRRGEPMRFTTQLLGFDAKRIHYFHRLFHGDSGELAATNELLSLHVSRETRRAAPMHAAIQSRLGALQGEHGRLPRPTQAGRRIGLDAGRAG